MTALIYKSIFTSKQNIYALLCGKTRELPKVIEKCFSTPSNSPPKDRPKVKTPIGKLDQAEAATETSNDPYSPFPDNKNPVTGELGGPRGPEPTRYGDWERKGRVSDF